MTKERKQEIIATYKREENDTGSPEVQIALLTERITELTEHLKAHKRENEECYTCKSIINRIVVGGRSTYYCPKCQK